MRAPKKLKNEGLLLTEMGGTVLRMELDRIPLWRGAHVWLELRSASLLRLKRRSRRVRRTMSFEQ